MPENNQGKPELSVKRYPKQEEMVLRNDLSFSKEVFGENIEKPLVSFNEI